MGVKLRREGTSRFRGLLNGAIAVIALYGMVDLGLRLIGRGGETALIQQPIWIVMLLVVIGLSLYDRASTAADIDSDIDSDTDSDTEPDTDQNADPDDAEPPQ